MEEELFEMTKISNQIIQIQEKYYQSWNRASMYLFLCGEESLLVDTGTGIVICYICHIYSTEF